MGNYEGFDSVASSALLFEVGAIERFLNNGNELMAGDSYLDNKSDAVIALWAMGVERLLKIIIGMDAVNSGEEWPVWHGASGHSIASLDEQLQGIALTRIEAGHATYGDYSFRLVSAWQEDQHWTLLIEILTAYAKMGRYYDLNLISMRQRQKYFSEFQPREKLLELQRLLFDETLFGGPMTEIEKGSRHADRRIVSVLLNWWFTVTTLCAQGVFGEVAKSVGSGVMPPSKLKHDLTILRKHEVNVFSM